jgi:CO dehydrogenase maturation factor
MKLAITGKGGVGKTTLASLLARLYAAEGNSVLAIDANPDANLASALGISAEEAKRITPIAEMEDLIEERTGAKPGSGAPFFKLNPRVDDIPERFSARIDGVRLLIMGTVKTGGSGCMCPESALLKNLMNYLLIEESDVVIMDMDAGVEHLGRGTARSVDAFIVVVEPGRRSIQTAEAIGGLARGLGIERCYIVGSKARSDADRQFIIDNTPQFELLGFIDYSPKIAEADLRGMSVFDADPRVVEEVRKIKGRLESMHKEAHNE